MDSQMAREIIFGALPIFEKHDIELGGGGLLHVKPAPTPYPEYLGTSGWYQIYGPFMGSSDMQAMTTPKLALEGLHPFKKLKKSIFFQK